MNKDNIKLNEGKYIYDYEYIVVGYQKTTVGNFKVFASFEALDEIDIISYLKSCTYLDNKYFVKYKPYLYYDLDLINRRAIYADLTLYKINSNNLYQEVKLPDFKDIFENIQEFENYLNNYFNSLDKHIEDYGTRLEYWEIDEVKAVLKQAGWDQYDLDHLKFINTDQGFVSIYDYDAWRCESLINEENISNQFKKHVKNLSFNLNFITEDHQWSGPDGFSGVFICKIDENTNLIPDKRHVVTMPNGDNYFLVEGD